MTKTASRLVTALVIASLSLPAPAWSQTTASPNTLAQAAPGSSTLQQPGQRPPAVRQPSAPGFSLLTAGECKRLGGKVYTAPNCPATGTRCVIELSGGDIRAPCIDEVEQKK